MSSLRNLGTVGQLLGMKVLCIGEIHNVHRQGIPTASRTTTTSASSYYTTVSKLERKKKKENVRTELRRVSTRPLATVGSAGRKTGIALAANLLVAVVF